jgi:hypothetical protein
MGDSDGPLAAHRLVGEPRRDARHKVKNRLAAVRRGCGIVQPRVSAVRLVRSRLVSVSGRESREGGDRRARIHAHAAGLAMIKAQGGIIGSVAASKLLLNSMASMG